MQAACVSCGDPVASPQNGHTLMVSLPESPSQGSIHLCKKTTSLESG